MPSEDRVRMNCSAAPSSAKRSGDSAASRALADLFLVLRRARRPRRSSPVARAQGARACFR